MERPYRCTNVGVHTKEGSSSSKKEKAIPCGVSGSKSTDSPVVLDKTSRTKTSFSPSKQGRAGKKGAGVGDGIGIVGFSVGTAVDGGGIGAFVGIGSRVGSVGPLGPGVGSGIGAVGDVGVGGELLGACFDGAFVGILIMLIMLIMDSKYGMPASFLS